MNKTVLNISFLLLMCSLIDAQNEKPISQEKLRELQSQQGIAFTENLGQVHDQNNVSRPDVLFGGQTKGLAFHLRNNGISYQLLRVDTWKNSKSKHEVSRKNAIIPQAPNKCTIFRVDINWLNSNGNAHVIKEQKTGGPTLFYNQNGELRANTYQQLTYQNLYDGIDLKWYVKNDELKYDYLCAAGSDYKKILLEIKGADHLQINKAGELEITTALGTVFEQAPVVIQASKTLKSSWVLNGNILSFNILGLNKKLPYIIDPAIRAWGTYYGGNSFDGANAVVTDASGNVYMAGGTYLASSTIIATSSSHQNTLAGLDDAYLVKFNSSGVRQWSTYYGGTDSDNGRSLAVDASTGDVYMSGITSSTNGIATAASHQSVSGGGGLDDAFLVKFNSNGVRQWATYYGGNSDDESHKCAVDALGNIYLSGTTDYSLPASSSTVIATTGAHQSVYGGGFNDAFLVKFNSNGIRQWATYYGGNDIDFGHALATYSTDVYLGGTTSSTNAAITTSACHQSTNGGNLYDAYLAKFNSNGVRQWGTFYGGNGIDMGFGCSTDGLGNVFLTGPTSSSATGVIATAASHQSVGVTLGDDDAYLVKFSGSGVRQWGTYYGGDDFDDGYSCTTDAQNNVYLVGSTASTLSSVMSTSGSHQTSFGNCCTNAYMAQFNNNGVRQWGTYYGDGGESGYACAVDASGNAYLVGVTTSTTSTTIATSGAHQTSYGGVLDGFLVKFVGCYVSNPSNLTPSANQNLCAGNSTTLSATSGTNTINWYATLTSTTSLGTSTAFITPTLSAGSYTYYAEASGCSNSGRTAITITVSSLPIITVNSATICSGASVIISPTAAGITSFNITGGNFTVTPSTTTSYSITGSGSGCAASNTAVATVSVKATPTIIVNSATICSGASVVITPTATGITAFNITGNNFTVSPNSNTSYSVTGTGTNGCLASNTAIASVSVNNTPSISVNSATICSGTSVVITPTAVGITVFNITGNNFTVSPTSNTSYSITGTGTNGCVSSNTAVALVSVNSSPTITANNGTICPGQIFTISPTGATNYTINGIAANSLTVNPTSSNNYTVRGTNGACLSQNTATSIVTVNNGPTITVNSGSICSGQSFVIVPSGASTYTIQGGTATVSPASTTNYTVTGTSASGCVGVNTATGTVTVNITPTVSVNSGSYCAGSIFTILPTGAGTYTIQGGSFTVSPASNTTYTLAGTSTAGCLSQNTATASVTVVASPTVAASNGTICAGQIFTISPSGASNYTINGISANSLTVNPSSSTSYTVRGLNASGCLSQNTATSVVIVNSSPTITVNSASICSGQSFVIVPSGANTYTVQGGTFTVNPLITTTYTVSGTSANGCVATNNATCTLVVNTTPTIAANGGTICEGSSFTINPSGASSYTYQGGTSVVSPTVNTSYTVTGGNGNCLAQNIVTVNITVLPAPLISLISTTICSGAQTTLDAGNAGSTYSWSTGANTPTIIVTNPGNYTVAVNNGTCTTTKVVSIGVTTLNLGITVNANTIVATASGANYQWLDCANNYQAIANATTQNFVFTSCTGTYAVKITQNGCTDTSACQSVFKNWLQKGGDIDGEAFNDESGYTVSLSSNGNVLAIGAPYNDGKGADAGHVRVYDWNVMGWIKKGADIDGEASEDQSGCSVSLSSDGSVLAIGARKNAGNGAFAGHVRVYNWNGTGWVKKGADIDGEAGGDGSGSSVSLSANGSVLAIGAINNSGNGSGAGHVRVYSWSGTGWIQKGADIDGEAASDYSGFSVSLSSDGSIIAVGAILNDGNGSNAGHVKVYSWNGTGWIQRGSDIDGEAAGDQSGWSISLSSDGSVLAVGASYNDGIGNDAGHVRVYAWNGTTWAQRGADINGESAGDRSGQAVSLSSDGSVLAVGAFRNSGNGSVSGHVKVYSWNGTGWIQRGTDIDGEAADDLSGYSVSLSSDGSVLAIGAIGNKASGSDAGHVRVYEIICSNITGIEEISNTNVNQLGVTIYPNPNAGLFTVKTSEPLKINISNVLGQIIYSQQMNAEEQEISLSQQPTGIYFVTLQKNDQQKTIKVIVQSN